MSVISNVCSRMYLYLWRQRDRLHFCHIVTVFIIARAERCKQLTNFHWHCTCILVYRSFFFFFFPSLILVDNTRNDRCSELRTRSLLTFRVITIVHSLITAGSLEIEKLLKIFFLGQIGGSQEAEAGECDFDLFLPRSFAREIFGANMTLFWHHYFRAIWPDQRKSCPRDVIFLSPRAWQKACELFDTLYDNA